MQEFGPSIGAAYGAYLPNFIADNPSAIDYVEIPFELLQFDPSVAGIGEVKPIILHCASLSLAGSIPPSEETLQAIKRWIAATHTPWLGEHMAYVVAEREKAGDGADAYAPGEPYNIGYTVPPPMNRATLANVCEAVTTASAHLDTQMLLENSPIYFTIPGTCMSQVDFISQICAQSSAGLLLDLAHFFITSRNLDFDPISELERLPLERVVEVHISGVDYQAGGIWDNHASRAPDIEFELLDQVLSRGSVKAITLEYNWSSRFPQNVLLQEIDRVRQVVTRHYPIYRSTGDSMS